MYVKNEQGERLLVYVLENGEVVPKYPEDSMVLLPDLWRK